MEMGPRLLVVKHGEHEPQCSRHREPCRDRKSSVPDFLLNSGDPTGAGDSFAGGFFGYLASQPALTPGAFRRAMFYGSVMGSFACERFGTERLEQLTRAVIDERFKLFQELTHLD